MSSFAGICINCNKPVMYKTLFGTLHLCISPKVIVINQIHHQQNMHVDTLGILRKIPDASKPLKVIKKGR